MVRIRATCLAAMIAALPVLVSAKPTEDPSYGSYLADRFGSTCQGFVSAADAQDAVRLRPYGNLINRLITQKWGALPDSKLKRVILNVVVECEAHGGSDFESIAKQAIARSAP